MAAHATLTASQPTLHSLLSPFPSNHSSFHGVSVSLPLQSFSFSLAAKNATKNKAAVAVLNGTSNGSTAVNVHAAGLPTGVSVLGFKLLSYLDLNKGMVEAEIVDGQILSIGFDTLIGSGFEVDDLDDDLGRLAAVPKKRTSRTKKRIRKNVWKRKASSAALKALSLAKSIYTGKSKSFLSNKLKNE
ncbi:hypothetical protein SADUNF_Sadunf09G0131200 [Salix dunnii]|uniref:Large ribosomal subunit protein bL32c n=1 Tax=Salix dunnii TaxID=1413687 RepID=A0A835JS38_9ROSI|nr:hypothetical protein SADUNF_Sadunf09G0131200 [Salix dunnii]